MKGDDWGDGTPEIVPTRMADILTDENLTLPEIETGTDDKSGPPWTSTTWSDLARKTFANHGFLIRKLWPGDAYGIIAAESKAGKSWLILDLAISVVTGTKFLGHFDIDRPGPVLVYAGEGGERNLQRRLTAIAVAKGVGPDDAHDLRIVARPPSLNNTDHLVQIADDVARTRPALVILDPLYLSITANMGQLNEVGQQLSRIQMIAEDAGAALVVVHHWNQTGTGTGKGRMSGAGAEQWGRVLWSVGVRHRGTDLDHPLSSVVTLDVEATGSEIADLEFSLTRKVWVDDNDDLDSPMNYSVTASDVSAGRVRTDGSKRPTKASDRVLVILKANEGVWMNPDAVQRVTSDEHEADPSVSPLKTDTVSKALRELASGGLVEKQGERGGTGGGGFEYRLAVL